MEALEKKLKEEETEVLEEKTEENNDENAGKELKGKKRSSFGIFKGKIHCDDSVWGFYGN